MSPEGFAYGVDQYLASLQAQVEVAKAFYFGRMGEAVERFFALPERVQLRIEQLLWEVSRGEGIDFTAPEHAQLVCDALLHSVEERMGWYDEELP